MLSASSRTLFNQANFLACRARRGIVRRPIPTAAMAPKREKTLEERFWDDYKPPKWTQNRYVWVASGVLAGALTIYSIIYL